MEGSTKRFECVGLYHRWFIEGEKVEGIVIKSIDYKEKSKLVYLYTPFGIQSIKALDAKGKLGFVTTLNLVEYEQTTSTLPTVIEYSLKKSYFSFYENIEKIGVITVMLDVLFHLEEDVNHARIYPFFLKCLDELENTKRPRFLLCLFLVKMLSVFGIKPELKKCVQCSRPRIVNFSILAGGALCDVCASYNERNYKILEAFSNLYFTKELSPRDLEISDEDLLEEVYSYYSIHASLKLKKYTI